MNSEIIFQVDEQAATVFVMKVYSADVDKIWNSFTQKEKIDQWWAPKPWKCETISMNFSDDGIWNYAMVGPQNDRHYSTVQYNEIKFHRSFGWSNFFSDENGNKLENSPTSNWLLGFTGVEQGTKLTVNLHFKSREEMKVLLDMGFEGGFKMGLNQLEDLLKNEI